MANQLTMDSEHKTQQGRSNSYLPATAFDDDDGVPMSEKGRERLKKWRDSRKEKGLRRIIKHAVQEAQENGDSCLFKLYESRVLRDWDIFARIVLEEYGIGRQEGDTKVPYRKDEINQMGVVYKGRLEVYKFESRQPETKRADDASKDTPIEIAPPQSVATENSNVPAQEVKTQPLAAAHVKATAPAKAEEDIVFERVPPEKYNNTGYRFSSRSGKVLTSGEVYKFIQAEQKKGNEEFKAAFKPHIKGKDADGAYPTFEIAGSKTKYFGYSFDPEFGKKKEEPKKESDNYFGEAQNTPAIVRLKDSSGKPFAGIRLHESPSPDDKAYKTNTGVAKTTYGPKSQLTILQKSNDKNPGWVYVRSADGNTGWIEERHLMKLDSGYGKEYTIEEVAEGDTVENMLRGIKDLQRDIGYDNRTFAYVLLQQNRGNAGVYINQAKFSKSLSENAAKNSLDPTYAGIRAVYQSIEVQKGAVIKVPTKAGIDKMLKQGQVPTRPDLMNAVIKGGRITEGLMIGIPKGFAMQAGDLATGLWDMIKGLVTGELFEQLGQLYDAFCEMDAEQRIDLLLQMVNIDRKKLKEMWEGGNVSIEARYEYMGEVMGRILFDVMLTVVTGGVMLTKTLSKIPAAAKVVEALNAVKHGMKGVTELLPPKTLEKLKRAGEAADRAKELAMAPVIFISKEAKVLLAKFPKLRKALGAVQATVGNTKFAIFEKILRTLPESILKHLELHPEMAKRFAQRALADPDFLAAARRGEVDKLEGLARAEIKVTNKITNKTIIHIFEGEINPNGRAVGCHHKSAINTGHSRLRPGEEITIGPDGLYRAKVDVKDINGNWIEKNASSTFFPDKWDKRKVLEEISEAFKSPSKITTGNKWEAMSPSGIKIGGYLDQSGNIATAFPIF